MAVSDPSPLLDDWFFRGVSTVVGAALSAGALIFATRKKTELSLLARVDRKIEKFGDRQTAEIERLDQKIIDERDECERQLQELRAQLVGPIPPYTQADIADGQRTVRGAQARQRRRKKP